MRYIWFSLFLWILYYLRYLLCLYGGVIILPQWNLLVNSIQNSILPLCDDLHYLHYLHYFHYFHYWHHLHSPFYFLERPINILLVYFTILSISCVIVWLSLKFSSTNVSYEVFSSLTFKDWVHLGES